jgi:DNA ligase-1
MNRFAALLDRLAYEPSRNAKLRLMTDYFRTTPDPDRGYALAAITGALSFRHAKPGIIRALIAERTDQVLFELSRDYVGDLSETVALMWPVIPPPQGEGGERSDAGMRGKRSGRRKPLTRLAFGSAPSPRILRAREAIPIPHHVGLPPSPALGKSELPAQLAAWLNAL